MTDLAAGVPPPRRAERVAWCFFDFANSAFNTLVITFVYAAFFTGTLAGARGDVMWANMLTVTGVAVAVLSPWLGAIADRRRGRKKRFLVGFSLTAIACAALLSWPSVPEGATHASASTVWLTLALLVVANVAFELAFVFYNAFLPELGDEHTVGRLSGGAYALGYVGGLLCLGVGLGFVGLHDDAGSYVFGPWLSTDSSWNVRGTNLLVAAWFLLFATPVFLLLRDRGARVSEMPAARSLRDALREVVRTLRGLRDYPDLLRLLVGRLFYNDAVISVIALAGVYMEGTLRMDAGQIMTYAIWLNVAAGIGAFGFGWLDDKIGAKTVIVISLLLLLSGAVIAVTLPDRTAFLVAATLVGIGLGPNQSASRSLMARFVPAGKSGEFYGLFALSGKATTWLGPLLFALVVDLTDSQRAGMAPLVVMLIVGLVFVLGIDESRGRQLAKTHG